MQVLHNLITKMDTEHVEGGGEKPGAVRVL